MKTAGARTSKHNRLGTSNSAGHFPVCSRCVCVAAAAATVCWQRRLFSTSRATSVFALPARPHVKCPRAERIVEPDKQRDERDDPDPHLRSNTGHQQCVSSSARTESNKHAPDAVVGQRRTSDRASGWVKWGRQADEECAAGRGARTGRQRAAWETTVTQWRRRLGGGRSGAVRC